MPPGKIRKMIRRFMTPQLVSSFYYFYKYGAKVSLRAEIDLTSSLILGRNCVISSFTKIKALGGYLRMGDRGGFGAGCVVSAYEGGIVIGDNFLCGPNVNIIGGNYIYHEKNVHLEDQGYTSKGIKIGNNVWVGAGTTILDGSIVGDNTIIVANSLVNRRYPPNSFLQGNPAKIILRRNQG